MFASCSKKNAGIERLAVLPANLLISDPTSEWLKVGIPVVLQHDLVTAHAFILGFASDEAAAIRGGATRILRTSIESRNGGLHVESSLVNVTTHKVERVESADASTSGVLLATLNILAKKMDPDAVEFSTRSSQAWQAFATAESNANPQQRAQFLNQAIGLDQNFGLAWVSLADLITPNGQTELTRMMDEAKSHRHAFTAYDGAKFDIAMNRLSNAAPGDQIKAAQAALGQAPNDLDAMTILGHNQILQGDSTAGEQSLRRAAGLNPANIGLRFQLARGLMEVRKFKEADSIFTSIDKSPAVYPELATCVLLEGDKARASMVFEKFIASVRNEELKPLLRASWQVMAGDRQSGIDLVLSAKFKTPNIVAIALSEATVWQMMGGDFANAQKTAAQLHQEAGPGVALPSVVKLLADQRSASTEWQGKVRSLPLPDRVKQPVLGYGFFLRGNYVEAAKVWQQINDAGHGADPHARVMLAASLDHAGKGGGLRIVIMPFTPEFTDLYAAVSFTEMRRLLSKS